MSDLNDDPYEKAAALGLDVVLPEDDELQLDLDMAVGLAHARNMARVNRVLSSLERNGIAAECSYTESKSGNTHMTVRLVDSGALLSHGTFGGPVMRIALQAIMGSDPVRELLGLLRLVRGTDRPPTLLFERPDAERFAYVPPVRAISLGGISAE